MVSNKMKGAICGVIAAVTYGTNPLGALKLYEEGVNPHSVLFYRYGIAILILAAMMFFKKESFSIKRKELYLVLVLGVLFAISSIGLFLSFKYMDAGIASTMLFIYPVMVAVLMAICFKEKVTLITLFSIIMSLSGIALLCQTGDGATVSLWGTFLVMLSSLSYAIYIVVVNKSSINMPPIKLTFYVMVFGTLTILVHSLTSPANHIQMLTTASMWGWSLMLAILPTVVSLVLMVVAVKEIGSTPTAIMGALEPVTAVFIGGVVFNESLTPRLVSGILMILVAVTLIILGKRIGNKMRIGLNKLYHH